MNARTMAIVLALVGASANTAHAELDVNRFLEMSTDEAGREVTETMLTGMESGMLWANTFISQYRKEQPIYCQPDKVTLTAPQILDMLRRGVHADSRIGQLPVGFGLLILLSL